MPKIPLSSEHKAANVYEFPKLFLDKGERARLVLLDPVPQTEFVHTMRAPQLVNGQPQYEKDQNGKDMMKYDFVGRHICLGSFDVIADKGLDVKGCPVCAASKHTDAVRPPERRHALNVIRYKTKPGSFAVADPYMVEVVVWAFGDKIHGQLIDFAEEWGDLRKRDLTLGPCEVKQFQKAELAVAAKAEWTTSKERIELTKEVFKNGMLGDLTVAIGRKLSREMVLEDLSKVTERHNVAFGKTSDVGVSAAEVDVEDILAQDEPSSTASSTGVDDVPADAEDEAPVQAEKKVKETVPPSKTDEEPLLDLEDILKM